MTDRLTIVSGDGHAAAPMEAYRSYLASKYHGALDELCAEADEYQSRIAGPAHPSVEAMAAFDDRGAMAAGGEAGDHDIVVRLHEMDAEGVTADIVHSGTQGAPPLWYGVANRPHPVELQQAGVEAYHRWLADFMESSGGRLFGVAEPGPTSDIRAAVDELEWLADHGFVSVGVPGQTFNPGLPPLWDPSFDPYWAACADLGLVLSVHAGWGQIQGFVYAFFDKVASQLDDMGGELDREKVEGVGMMVAEELATSEESPLRLDVGPQQAMWQLMVSGVFDRHPALRLALTEVRAAWVPATLAALDRVADEQAPSLALKPSEYFARNCAVAPSSTHRSEIEMRHEIGVDRLLFGTDYPHHEGTWPNTRAWIQVAFEGVPEAEARRMLGENAIELYGLNRGALGEVADRIGPSPADVLVDHHTVEQGLIDHFHKRAGFSRPADAVDVESVSAGFADDLARITGAR